jgi:hypothetical protein
MMLLLFLSAAPSGLQVTIGNKLDQSLLLWNLHSIWEEGDLNQKQVARKQ